MDQHHRIACTLSYYDWDWPFPGVSCQIQHNKDQLEEYLHQLKWWLPCRFLPPGAEKIWPGELRSRRSAAEDHMMSFASLLLAHNPTYSRCGMEGSSGKESCIHFKIKVLARKKEERGKILTWPPLLWKRGARDKDHPRPQVPKCHHTMPRINQLHHLSGPHRGFSQVAYESESDSDERDWRGGHPPTIAFARSNRQQQRLPNLVINDQKGSADRGFAQVSQAIPREDTPTLRRSRSSGPPRRSSGAATSSGPPSPWKSGETKKRIIDALKNEHSDIHLHIGDETTTGYAVNYAQIRELYAPKHDRTKFRQNLQRLIENHKKMTGPFKEMTCKKKSTNEIEPWYLRKLGQGISNT